jgi:hypothetical protein
MTQPSQIKLAIAVVTLAALSGAADDERGLWAVWQRHVEAPDAHAEIVATCTAFETNAPADPLIAVTRGIAAWHLLRQGERARAEAILTPMQKPGSDPLGEGASEIARAWLTRLDMENVKAGLKALYVENVAFPESLEALPAEGRPPAADRWGRPWRYSLTGFQALTGMNDQKYELWSQTLGKDGDLKNALAAPYGGHIDFKPVSVNTAGQNPVARFTNTAGETVHLSVGTRNGDTLFSYMGQALIVLSDRDHWKVLRKP